MNNTEFEDALARADTLRVVHKSFRAKLLREGLLKSLELLEWQGNEEDAATEFEVVIKETVNNFREPVMVSVIHKEKPDHGTIFKIDFGLENDELKGQLYPVKLIADVISAIDSLLQRTY